MDFHPMEVEMFELGRRRIASTGHMVLEVLALSAAVVFASLAPFIPAVVRASSVPQVREGGSSAEDESAGQQATLITFCHLPNTKYPMTMRLPKLEAEGYIKRYRGDVQGTCPTKSNTRQQSIEFRLDRVIYPLGSSVLATVQLGPLESLSNDAFIMLSSPRSGDLEVVGLQQTNPSSFVAMPSVPVRPAGAGAVIQHDGVLSLAPGEMFSAFLITSRQSDARIATAFGLFEDTTLTQGQVIVRSDLALTGDELQPPPGGKRLGTLTPQDGLPVQLPLDELVVYPRSPSELHEILDKTQGHVIADDSRYQENGVGKAFLVQVSTDQADVGHLSQMRVAVGETETLYASSPETLSIVALAMQLRLSGYRVAVNPRLQFMGAPTTADDAGIPGTRPPFDAMSGDSNSNPVLHDDQLDVRKAMAYLALFDKDAQRVPMAFLDMGFAPNWDFRGFDPTNEGTIFQRNGAGQIGSAAGPPTVGSSLFGAPVWHGSMVVSTAAGVLNNGYGVAGTGGQIAVPMLYKMNLSSYAFEMGQRMSQATEDGAAIITISAGYPCRVVTNIDWLGFDVCSAEGRIVLCEAINATLHASVDAVAPFILAIPFAGPVILANMYASVETLHAGCLSTFTWGDVRGVMQDGVNYATSHGVSVVSAAGNSQDSTTLGSLCSIIRCGAQDAGSWQVIPCVLDGVVCVGAADPAQPYENLQYFGSVVDVWAPGANMGFWAPPSLTAVGTVDQQTYQSLDGGTSGAAAFISGVIGMMEAANPALNPTTPGLTMPERAAIPGRIQDLLTNNATPAAGLPVDPTGNRRNLVEAFRAVQAAALGNAGAPPSFIGDYFHQYFQIHSSPLEYVRFPDALGFDETNTSNDDSPYAANVRNVDASTDALFTGTVVTFAETERPGGSKFIDVDYFKWTTPSLPGVYRGGTIRLAYPRGFEPLLVNSGNGTEVTSGVSPDLEVWEFSIPDQRENTMLYFNVSGGGNLTDNVYAIEFLPATWLPLTYLPDLEFHNCSADYLLCFGPDEAADNIEIEIDNGGTADVGGFQVRLEYWNLATGTQVHAPEIITMPGVTRGETVTVVAKDWCHMLGMDLCEYHWIIDPGDVIQELREDNNSHWDQRLY
jgi:hypothetical protein